MSTEKAIAAAVLCVLSERFINLLDVEEMLAAAQDAAQLAVESLGGVQDAGAKP